MATSLERSVYAWSCVCVLPTAPKEGRPKHYETKTARGRRVCENTHLRFDCFMSKFVLLLLLLRIRIVYSIHEIKSKRIRFVYAWIRGGGRGDA